MSGSNKMIGFKTKSRLNPKSQVYKKNMGRTSNQGSAEQFKFANKDTAAFATSGTLETLPSANNFEGPAAHQNMYQKQSQYQSNKFGAFTTPYFVDTINEQKSKSHVMHPPSRF